MKESVKGQETRKEESRALSPAQGLPSEFRENRRKGAKGSAGDTRLRRMEPKIPYLGVPREQEAGSLERGALKLDCK